MIRVAALTSGRFAASTRFRVRQHIEPLRAEGIAVREFVPAIPKHAPLPGWPSHISIKYALPYFLLWQAAKVATRLPGLIGSARAQITWLERQLLPGYLTLERCLQQPMVFDVDDAIWQARPFGAASVAETARRAEVILAGNSYLADWFSQWSSQIRIIPTAVDSDRFQPVTTDQIRRKEKYVIGWTGMAVNLKYLEAIERPLNRFLNEHRNTELLVVADKPPVFREIDSERVRFQVWSEEVEVSTVQEMSVGLMPLPDNSWTRGKCSFKMLQYMACGIPVIASPVGMNAEVLARGELGICAKQESDWYDGLRLCYANPDLAVRYGSCGRAVLETHYSRRVVSRQIAAILKELV